MSDRQTIACETARGLSRFAPRAANTPVLLGFDGFVDSIIRVVDKRHDTQRYDAIATIAEFGQRISAAAGHSSNFELVTTQRKLGGNGPIMANALAHSGLPVTYVGTLGLPEIDPVFADFAERAQVHSVLATGTTDALEFADGKLMLGKIEHLGEMDYRRIVESLGEEAFANLVGRSRLIGMVNWTMLPNMGTIWDALIERVLPALGRTKDGRRRMIFIDLADPAKRTRADLLHALDQITRMNVHADVLFGLNLAESMQVAAALGIAVTGEPAAAVEQTARAVRDKLGVHAVVVHPRTGAAAAMCDADGQVHSATFHGPFVKAPKLSTGAGDNFNAGFCLGCLADLPVDQALCAGTAASGYYVRQGRSATLAELASFCDCLPDPEC